MSSLQTRHRIVAGIMLLVLTTAMVAWLVALRPLRQTVRRGADDVTEKRRSLQKRGWPQQQHRLEDLLTERKRILAGDGHADPGLTARTEQVVYRATSMYRERIRQSFENDLSFVRHASNLDFREALNALQRRASAKSIWLSPEVLKLSDDTSSPYTYQLLLQVWTVERLLELVLESGLLVAADEAILVESGAHRHPAAKVTVQPLAAYYLNATSKQPYLLGIPVRLQLRGGLNDLKRFLAMLTGGDTFLPPLQLEILSDDPASETAQKEDGVLVNTVTANVVCSAFFSFPRDMTARANQGEAVQRGEPGV